MTAGELMSKATVTIAPEENVVLAARLLSRHNIGVLPVVSPEGRLKGIVTDRDIVLRCVAAESDPVSTPVSEIMTRRLATVAPDDDARQAAGLMALHQVRRLPVTGEDRRLLGMLSLGDMASTKGFDMECAAALAEISGNLRRL